jgi:hypothetical protein
METKPDLGAIKAAAKEEFRGVPGIEGFGLGDQALRVYVSNGDVPRQLPRTYRGVTVECVVTGDITSQTSRR